MQIHERDQYRRWRSERIYFNALRYDISETFRLSLQYGGGTSILINDINLEIDEDGNVLYVWGLAPKSAWEDTGKLPPSCSQAGMQCVLDKVLCGVSIRINDVGSWPMFFNKANKWFFIGEDINYTGFEQIEFTQNCVANLSDSGELKGLWLRPKFTP